MIYEIFWYAGFLLVGIGLILGHLIAARLKERHSDTWKTLGQPTTIYSFSQSVKILKYLYTFKYLRTGDRKLITLCHFDNLVHLVFFIILLWPFFAAL